MTATALKPTNRNDTWQPLCTRADLVAFSGVAAWLSTQEGPAQVALFYLPGHAQELYALDHFDPFSKAYVIARGIIGDIKGSPVVASPLYNQHFRLEVGQCLEEGEVQLRTWRVAFKGDEVWVEG
jgi:nitrite reductase (NADH) small subunit